jgi:hypothetical protein
VDAELRLIIEPKPPKHTQSISEKGQGKRNYLQMKFISSSIPNIKNTYDMENEDIPKLRSATIPDYPSLSHSFSRSVGHSLAPQNSKLDFCCISRIGNIFIFDISREDEIWGDGEELFGIMDHDRNIVSFPEGVIEVILV